MQRPLPIAWLIVVIGAGACGGDASVTMLDIDTKTGYAVIVERLADRVAIGFNTNRDAAAGEEYEVTQAIWRVDDGPWREPPATCVAKGQRVELGITMVENEARPGLLMERVVWVVCLGP